MTLFRRFAVVVTLCCYGAPLSDSLSSPGRSSITTSSNSHIPILFDSSNHLHRSLTYHPEQPARIEACVKALLEHQQEELQGASQKTMELIDVAIQMEQSKREGTTAADAITHQPISESELDRASNVLLQIHSPQVVTQLETKCRQSRQRRIDEGKDPLGFVGFVDDDTYVTTETYDVCLRATATWMRAIDWLHDCQCQCQESSSKIPTAMALTRPPGHHATQTMSNGFCLFNYCAAAAYHYQQLQQQAANNNIKISILDWDVHYGQGVADIVSNYPQTMRYASIHQSPAFPYMGQKREISNGNILTIPISAENTWTCGYQTYFQEALDFLFDDNQHQPDLVIVCAGYDALDSDELASVSLNAKDYGRMTHALLDRIQQQQQQSTKNKPVALLLGMEGGYQLGHMAGGGNLQQAVVETVKALLEHPE